MCIRDSSCPSPARTTDRYEQFDLAKAAADEEAYREQGLGLPEFLPSSSHTRFPARRLQVAIDAAA
eukprot:13749346-Alexandrium_andersonii.AAC.1